jgi:hypothetical protein
MKKFEFSSERASTPTRKVEFDLNGEVIHCIPDLDGLTLLEFGAAAGAMVSGLEGSGEDGMSTAEMGALATGAGKLIELLQSVVVPDDWDRFVKTVKSPGSGVGPEQIAELASWLMEQYTADTPSA